MISIRDALRSIELLARLPDPIVDSLANFATIRSVRAGETLFCQNEPSPYCYGILSGEIVIQRVSKDPRFPSKVLGVLGPGGLFGESALFEDSPRAAMASAKEAGDLVAIVGTQFRDWLMKEPSSGVPLLMGLLDCSLRRLRLTSHELSIVYGIGRLLAGSQDFSERLAAGMEFLKSSIDGLDDVFCFETSAYWEEFDCLYPAAESDPLPAIPFSSVLAAQASSASGAFVLHQPEQRQALSDLRIPCAEAASVGLVPLADPDHHPPSLLGFLLMACRLQQDAFSRDRLLMLSAMANPLAEALARHRRQKEALAQDRLDQSRRSFNL